MDYLNDGSFIVWVNWTLSDKCWHNEVLTRLTSHDFEWSETKHKLKMSESINDNGLKRLEQQKKLWAYKRWWDKMQFGKKFVWSRSIKKCKLNVLTEWTKNRKHKHTMSRIKKQVGYFLHILLCIIFARQIVTGKKQNAP